MKDFDIVIGLEIHVQLKTKSKMFCRSSAAYFGAEPNSHVCPVCLGLPGALPVPNQAALDEAVLFALGLNCQVGGVSKFDRKNYFYPDLPKGFQISQFDQPIGVNGKIEVDGQRIRINRAHLEEDTGKLIHSQVDGEKLSLIDFNRSGVPLLEIVSEPDITSPEMAKAYAKKIHQIARYLEVAEVDMEKAGMRFDANVSLKPKGSQVLGTKVEIKNINSFRFLEKALGFEIERQLGLIQKGERIVQETRGWVESTGTTVSQRTKETSPDYRYFPEPDLPELFFDAARVKQIKDKLPEMPIEKEKRFTVTYKLDTITAQILTEDKNLAQWYEEVLRLYDPLTDTKDKPQKVAKWVVGELIRQLKETGTAITTIPIEPAGLVELLVYLDKGELSQTGAKQVFARMFESGLLPSRIIAEGEFSQISDETDLASFIKQVLKEQVKAVADFKAGKETSFGFLLGQVMRQTQGRANPEKAAKILKEELKNGN